jgi:flagellar protein FlbT
MSLKLSLKPHERMIIGGAVVRNGSKHTDLFIENNVPTLRQKDIMSQEQAVSPCQQIYFTIQLMYIDIDEKNMKNYHQLYWEQIKDVLQAAPSTIALIDRISGLILESRYYQALKQARKLIDYEEELIKNASQFV